MAHKKLHLPEKTCEHCQRPFCWRRKWARDWDNVKYCSQRCKRTAHSSANNNPAASSTVPANLCAASSVEGEF